MQLKVLLTIFLAYCFNCFSSICYFAPPNDWKCSDPKKMSKYVSVGFIGKSKSSFKPSINLASEKTDASLKQYINAIKNSYKNEKEVTFREIGNLTSKLNEKTILVEIDKKSPAGDICILQSVTKKNDEIFVLTGAVLKEELLTLKEEFFRAFKSIKISENLLDEVEDPSLRRILEQKYCDLIEKKLSVKDFEKHIEENYESLGSYWKILVLKQAYEETSKK